MAKEVQRDAVTTHGRQDLLDIFESNTVLYESALTAAMSILTRVLPGKVVVATTSRVKDFDSFYEKANRLVEKELKYPKPFEQILDIFGVRIVVIAQRNIADVCETIRQLLM